MTIETVPLKLSKKDWNILEINPDQTYFADEFVRHVLNITRIYFRYGDPEAELIGKFVKFFLSLFYCPSLNRKTLFRHLDFSVFCEEFKVVSQLILMTFLFPRTNVNGASKNIFD